jgi:hypothetical protein
MAKIGDVALAVLLGGALEVVELLVVVDEVVAGGRLVEVVVGCGGQLPKRGPQTSVKRSRSVRRPARAETRTGSVPGRWRSSGPRTGTVNSTGGPQPDPPAMMAVRGRAGRPHRAQAADCIRRGPAR